MKDTERIGFVQVSLLELIPHLPVKHIKQYDREKNKAVEEEWITHSTIHTKKVKHTLSMSSFGVSSESTEVEYIAFHTENEEKGKPWWSFSNTRRAASGMVTHITPEEADRIGITYKKPERGENPKMRISTFRVEEGDERPAARKSAQYILYGDE